MTETRVEVFWDWVILVYLSSIDIFGGEESVICGRTVLDICRFEIGFLNPTSARIAESGIS